MSEGAKAPGLQAIRARFDRAAAVRRGGLAELMTESALREADLALAESEILSLAQRLRPTLLGLDRSLPGRGRTGLVLAFARPA
jgi:uncharacterized protein (DUF1778 family)